VRRHSIIFYWGPRIRHAGKGKTRNHYSVRDKRYIVGHDCLDAIKNNLIKLTTSYTWDRKNQRQIKEIFVFDEALAEWRPGILGGKGGVEVVFRGGGNTCTEWVECKKEDWPHGCVNIDAPDTRTYLMRDIPADLYKAVKIKAAEDEIPIRTVILRALAEYVEKQ